MGGEHIANNCYYLSSNSRINCNKVTLDTIELWHQRLGHLNFHDLVKASRMEAIVDLPMIYQVDKGKCGPCQLGKQTRTPHKKTTCIFYFRNLELFHLDLMGPTRTASLGGKKYILVVVDDFSQYTQVILLREKSKAFDQAQILFKKIQNEQDCLIMNPQ